MTLHEADDVLAVEDKGRLGQQENRMAYATGMQENDKTAQVFSPLGMKQRKQDKQHEQKRAHITDAEEDVEAREDEVAANEAAELL